MSLKFDVKVRLDMKDLQKVKRRLIKVAQLQTQVGYFDGKPHPNQPDMTVAQIGAINEFGAPEDNIPERPFMTTAVRNTRLAKPLADNLKRYLRRTQSLKGVWTAVGIVMARGISKTIAEFSDPPNAPFTIAKKGFDDPLVETGHLRDSVTHRIRRR